MPLAARAASLIVAVHALVLGVWGRTPPGPQLSNLLILAAALVASAAGLRLLRRETFLPYEFLLVFGK